MEHNYSTWHQNIKSIKARIFVYFFNCYIPTPRLMTGTLVDGTSICWMKAGMNEGINCQWDTNLFTQGYRHKMTSITTQLWKWRSYKRIKKWNLPVWDISFRWGIRKKNDFGWLLIFLFSSIVILSQRWQLWRKSKF